MKVSLKKDPFEEPSDEVKNQAQAIDIKDLSEDDLQSLWKEDPFMYYSIPAIRMAAIYGKDIDPSDKVALCCSNPSSSDDQQEPASKRTKSTYSNRSRTTVLRRTRISFEAPMDLEDIMMDVNALEEDLDVLDESTSSRSGTSQDTDGEGYDDDHDLNDVLLELLHELIVEEE
jgi:hypothetical protein